jgi:hypothetical protein
MYSAWRLVLGLLVASACGSFALTGCEKGQQAAKPAPAPSATAKPAAAVPTNPAAVPTNPAAAPTKPAATPTTPAGADATKGVVKAVEKAAPPLAEALPPDLIQIKAEITRAKAQMDMTLAKLEVLAASTGDVEKPSEEATAAIEALDAETKGLMKRGDEMRQLGAAYFEAWEKELASMTTASVKKIATERKAELSGKYTDVLTAMQETRAAFDPFWADVQATKTTIEDGLTPETLKGLAPQVKKVKDGVSLVKGRLDAVYARVDQVASIYSQKP